MRHFAFWLALIVAFTQSMPVWAADTREAIHLLLKHVAVNPPQTYDVTCYQYSTLRKMSEAETRQFVEEMFVATDEHSPDTKDPAWRARNMEKEYKRLLDEQERPRKTKLRLRGNFDNMRIDQLVMTSRPGQDQKPLDYYDESFVNLGFPFEADFESYRIDWSQANFILGKHKGKEYAYTDRGSWMAGTVGLRIMAVVKSALGVTAAENELGYLIQDPAAIDQLVQGIHKRLSIDISEDVHDGLTRRIYTFTIKDAELGEGRTLEAWCDPLDCGKTWKTSFYGRGGHEEHCEVKQFNDQFHFPQTWVETQIKGTGKPPEIREYELIAARIPAPELTEEFFQFKIEDPTQWAVVDHRVNPPTIVHRGVPQNIVTGNPLNWTPPKPVAKVSWTLFCSNVIIVGFGLVLILLRLRRKSKTAN